jgi:transposase-like protein
VYRDPKTAGTVRWHFEDVIILLCVRWYLRYSLTYRDLEEIMLERNLSVDHVTIWRWVQRYRPVLNQRIRREKRHPNRSWRVDETNIRVAGSWAYLYRAVDSAGETIEFMLSPKRDLIAAKLFLRLALSGGGPRPRVINVDGHPAYASAVPVLCFGLKLAVSSWSPAATGRSQPGPEEQRRTHSRKFAPRKSIIKRQFGTQGV